MQIAIQTFLTLSCMGLIGLNIIIAVCSFEILTTSGVMYVFPFYMLFCIMLFVTIKVIEITYNLNKGFERSDYE